MRVDALGAAEENVVPKEKSKKILNTQ